MIAADKAKLFTKKNEEFLEKTVSFCYYSLFCEISLRRKLHLLCGQMVFNK